MARNNSKAAKHPLQRMLYMQEKKDMGELKVPTTFNNLLNLSQ